MRLSPHICERTNTMTDTNNYTDFSDNNSDTKELTTDNQGESNSSDAPSSDAPSSDAPSFGQHPPYYSGAELYGTNTPLYDPNDSGNGKKDRSGVSKGFIAALLCICLVFSCVIGALSGAFVSLYLAKSGASGNGDDSSNEASIKISYATSEETPIVTATSIAKEAVVVIDVYTSANTQSVQKAGSGSGVIWTESGYIVTCNHVIDGGSLIVVTLYSGDKFEAAVIGRDPKTDLAVIKIEPGENEKFACATLRATDIVLGETVLAIGNPLGTLSNTVTEGIISCLERQITVEGQTMTLMQTSAAVNPGNSGGGLFDTNGSLVGIVNAKSSQESVEGIGFAIPIATAINIATDLIENGYVTGRPALGFESVYIDSTNYDQYPELYDYAVTGSWFLRISSGVYVTSTEGVAGYGSQQQLQFGDKITQIGSTRITVSDDIISALSKYSAGDTVEITVTRKKQNVSIMLILSEAGGA